MNFRAITELKHFKPAVGAALAALCGLALWASAPGEAWVNASYDYLFRFGSRAVTNGVVVIFLDNEAYDGFHQVRGEPWDRGLHAQLLNRLADDGCALVVFDTFFHEARDREKDVALATAMRRQKHVALMAEQADITHPEVMGARPTLPAEPFLNAAGTNCWGVAWLDPDLDEIVRRHWPFPEPGPYPSLPWTAAQLTGAKLDAAPQERWLRYYGREGPWTSLSYRYALTEPANFYRNKVVFIGRKPKTSLPDEEADEFRTPYTLWTGEAVGGVEILACSYLNLVNGEWLERPPRWVEALVLAFAGALLGGGLCRLRPLASCGVAAGAALAVMLGAIWLSHAGNYWFPWLVIAGGQAPCALAWALAPPRVRRGEELSLEGMSVTEDAQARVRIGPLKPNTPDYELCDKPFGEGAYGKVWLARNAIGQWQALKAVYLAKFGQNPRPYEREFNGIRKYKPLSDKHPGLLRVDFISRKKRDGYFYYVMELGDALHPGWEQNPLAYQPRDLAAARANTQGGRLPAAECVRIGLALAEALEFLHQKGLTHRDIKPRNIIFVSGQPKLADVGLVDEAHSAFQEKTLVGTLGYMPPSPEPPGTPQADIYGLGMVLYVIHTGKNPNDFPDFSAAPPAAKLQAVILQACHGDCAERHASATELRAALLKVQEEIAANGPKLS